MSSRAITILGYGVIAFGGVALGAAARRGKAAIPTFGSVVRWALHTRSGRIGLFAAWAWTGLHFLG